MGTFWEDMGVREASEEEKAKIIEGLRLAKGMLRHHESPQERQKHLEYEREKRRRHLFEWLMLSVSVLAIAVAIALAKGWI